MVETVHRPLRPPRPLIVGNWKMFGLGASIAEAQALAEALRAEPPAARVAICPPATLIHRMAEAMAGAHVEVGAQDCHASPEGACTGDLSAEMMHDAGARLVILGHSERRDVHRESDEAVAAKVEAAMRAGLEPVVCVGETLAERQEGLHLNVVRRQVERSLPTSLEGRSFAVAYEPVWAIGTGLTPSTSEIEEVHGEIRLALSDRFPRGGAAPILYGGSVRPANAREILQAAEVGGALVGGASLVAEQFLAIIRSA